MLSNLKLLILENPTTEYLVSHISENDKIRVERWYEKSTGRIDKIEQIIDVLIWCAIDGEYFADSKNPEIFVNALDEKAKDFGVIKEELSSLFFSHKSLFDDYEPITKINSSKPIFVVFEGLDGSGKSTQIDMLKDKLKLMGRKVCVTAEPTNSATGGLIRDSLSNNYKREATELASLFLADRISHNVNPVWGIQKLLSDNMDIICDRYYYSSFAYQGLDSDLEWIMNMNLNCPQIRKPDLCIYLDVDPKRCKKRVDSERAHLEIFENDEKKMENTRVKFLEVFKRLNSTENIKIIDANRPINVVADEVLRLVMSL